MHLVPSFLGKKDGDWKPVKLRYLSTSAVTWESLELAWFVSVFLNSIVVVFFIGETVVAFFVFQD